MAKLTELKNAKRAEVLETIKQTFLEMDEDIMQIKSNELAFPIVLEDGSEHFIKIAVSIPTGNRKENDPFDAYSMAEVYADKLKQDKEKAEKKAKEKAEKIKRDQEYRERVKEIHSK